jgi:hypothetical protein
VPRENVEVAREGYVALNAAYRTGEFTGAIEGLSKRLRRG